MLFLLGACACLGSFVVTKQLRSPAETFVMSPQAPVSDLRPSPQLPPVKSGKNQRYVYPYSVIPGGVLSREELVSVIDSDPVVRDHYARFALDQVRIIRAEKTQFMHVAYRMQNKIYWTANKVKIPEGETLITDGNEIARTRCGNVVSAAPKEPVSEEEPAVETFDTPLLAQVDAPELELPPEIGMDFQYVPTLEPYIPVRRPTVLPYYYRPLFVTRSTEVIPEPATFGLLALGLLSLVTYRIMRRK